MNDILFNEILSGTDFTYYQDCNYDSKNIQEGYQEHYFNPDCVIVNPDNKEYKEDYSGTGPLNIENVEFTHSPVELDYTLIIYYTENNEKFELKATVPIAADCTQ